MENADFCFLIGRRLSVPVRNASNTDFEAVSMKSRLKQKTNMKKNRKSSDKSLTPEQCAQVLAVAESEMKGLVLLAMATGQRIKDIVALKRGDVDMTRSIVRFHIGKSNRVVEMPLDPRMRNWLEQQPGSTIPVDLETPLFRQLSARGAAKTAGYLRQLGEKVGVVVSAVSFRHSFFKQLVETGTPTAVIQRLMGYGSRQ